MAEGRDNTVLRFENVSVAFDDVLALDKVSFVLERGESRVVLGTAGSGKTTLLKTAVGLIRPDSGRVELLGHDISKMEESELYDLRSRVGILFQEVGLFDSLTVEENVAYPLRNQHTRQAVNSDLREQVVEALRFVELEHTLDKFPSELSGGMRRRVGIARAVVTAPDVVLYDSPTAGLDPITAYTIMGLLIKERDIRNAATVMVTHRYQDGQLLANFRYNPQAGEIEPASRNGSRADLRTKFMVLQEGRLVFEGVQEELEASTDPYVSKFVRR
ncbi:MAG: ATP-binding cassette domain-containing protein [Bryobacteraceae bacterium]|nr:ATP-binding cassette domain-containing protein [Bryobacteraceae bacterium]